MASVTVKQEPLDSSEIDTRWISLVHAIILKTTGASEAIYEWGSPWRAR